MKFFIYFLLIFSQLQSYGQSSNCETCGDNFRNLKDFKTSINDLSTSMLRRNFGEAVDYSLYSKENVVVPFHLKSLDSAEKVLKDLNWTNPDDAALFLVVRLPGAFSMRQAGRSGATIQKNYSNMMVHGQTLFQKESWETRIQGVDGIGETTTFKVEFGDRENEISLSLRNYEIVGKPSEMIGYFTNDKLIEQVHSVMANHMDSNRDPAGRKHLGYDLVWLNMVDTEGRKLDLKDGQSILLPLIIKAGKYKDLIPGDTNRTTLNYGAQVGIPLNRQFDQLGAGAYSNIAITEQLSSRKLLHIAAGLGLNIHKNIYGGYHASDSKYDFSYNTNLAIGLSCLDSQGPGKTSIILSVTTNSPLLKGSEYKAPKSGAALVDKQSFEAANTKDQVLGIDIQWEDGKGKTAKFGCQEDGSNRLNKGIFKGNNSRDFSCNFQINQAFKSL